MTMTSGGLALLREYLQEASGFTRDIDRVVANLTWKVWEAERRGDHAQAAKLQKEIRGLVAAWRRVERVLYQSQQD